MRAMVLGAYFLFTVSIVLCRVYFPTLPACCGAMRPLEPNRVGDIRACVPEHIACGGPTLAGTRHRVPGVSRLLCD